MIINDQWSENCCSWLDEKKERKRERTLWVSIAIRWELEGWRELIKMHWSHDKMMVGWIFAWNYNKKKFIYIYTKYKWEYESNDDLFSISTSYFFSFFFLLFFVRLSLSFKIFFIFPSLKGKRERERIDSDKLIFLFLSLFLSFRILNAHIELICKKYPWKEEEEASL